MKKEELHLEEAHKRGLTSALLYIEELLSEIESALHNKKGVFFESINNLNSSQNEKIKYKKKEMLQEIEKIKETLQLEKKEIISSHTISSRCVAIWETLCDMESQKLKRYGTLQKEISDYLDPIIKNLKKYNEEILDSTK